MVKPVGCSQRRLLDADPASGPNSTCFVGHSVTKVVDSIQGV